MIRLDKNGALMVPPDSVRRTWQYRVTDASLPTGITTVAEAGSPTYPVTDGTNGVGYFTMTTGTTSGNLATVTGIGVAMDDVTHLRVAATLRLGSLRPPAIEIGARTSDNVTVMGVGRYSATQYQSQIRRTLASATTYLNSWLPEPIANKTFRMGILLETATGDLWVTGEDDVPHEFWPGAHAATTWAGKTVLPRLTLSSPGGSASTLDVLAIDVEAITLP